jgi:hypothetical protein
MVVSCKNCNKSFEGDFCPACGQKAATHSIDHRFIFHEIPHGIFHIDKGIFYTIKELSLRPGSTYLEYMKGKRVKHFSPITYIIILSSIYLLVRNLVWHSYAHEELQAPHSLSEKIRQFQYIGFMFLGATPVFALFSWLFFRKRSTLNYWEFLVGHTFFLGHSILILIVFMLIRVPFPSTILSGTIFIAEFLAVFLYLLFCSYQLLKPFYEKRLALITKATAALILSIGVSFGILITVVRLLEMFS